MKKLLVALNVSLVLGTACESSSSKPTPPAVTTSDDRQAVEADMKDVKKDGFLGLTAKSNFIYEPLLLPNRGAQGSVLIWTVTPSRYLEKGQLVLPLWKDGNQSVALRVKVIKGSVSQEHLINVVLVAKPQSDADKVVADLQTLTLDTILNGQGATSVTKNLSFPSKGAHGTPLLWTTDKPAIIDEDGTVTLPDFDEGQQTVHISVRANTGSPAAVPQAKVFVVTVLPAAPSDADAVAYDAQGLTFDVIRGNNISSNAVTTDLKLSDLKLVYANSVSWSSDKPAVISTNGRVIRPVDADERVVLTASFKKGAQTKDVTIPVVVKQQVNDDAQKLEEDTNSLQATDFLNGQDAQRLTKDLVLPTIGKQHGTPIGWKSSKIGVLTHEGVVICSQTGDQTVTLTASLARAQLSPSLKDFNLTVLKCAASAADKMLADIETITYSTILGSQLQDAVTQNLSLPDRGANGTAIRWQSSDKNVISDNGSVSRNFSEKSKTVTLTAIFSLSGTADRTKTFTVTVLSNVPVVVDPASKCEQQWNDYVKMSPLGLKYTMTTTMAGGSPQATTMEIVESTATRVTTSVESSGLKNNAVLEKTQYMTSCQTPVSVTPLPDGFSVEVIDLGIEPNTSITVPAGQFTTTRKKTKTISIAFGTRSETISEYWEYKTSYGLSLAVKTIVDSPAGKMETVLTFLNKR